LRAVAAAVDTLAVGVVLEAIEPRQGLRAQAQVLNLSWL